MGDKPSVFSARVISLGRVTVPEQLRTLWKIIEGDIVELKIVSVQKNPNTKKKKVSS